MQTTAAVELCPSRDNWWDEVICRALCFPLKGLRLPVVSKMSAMSQQDTRLPDGLNRLWINSGCRLQRAVTPGAGRPFNSFPVTPPVSKIQAHLKCSVTSLGSQWLTAWDFKGPYETLEGVLAPTLFFPSSWPRSRASHRSKRPVCWGPAASAQELVKELNGFCGFQRFQQHRWQNMPQPEENEACRCPGQRLPLPLLHHPLAPLKWCPAPCYGQQRWAASLASPCALAREGNPQHDLHRAGDGSGGRAMALKMGTAAVGDSLMGGNVIYGAN